MKKEPILQMGSDRMIKRHVYEKSFTVSFLTGVSGKKDLGPI
jgi:hypothetical protein